MIYKTVKDVPIKKKEYRYNEVLKDFEDSRLDIFEGFYLYLR